MRLATRDSNSIKFPSAELELRFETRYGSWSTSRVHIGTSGWHYKHWLGDFYPPKMKPFEMFAFYAEQFDTVEINNTFYRLPSEQTVDSWREASPTTFCLAVKASRFITHMKKLKHPDCSTKFFAVVADRLKTKLGPVLFQLPPGWFVN